MGRPTAGRLATLALGAVALAVFLGAEARLMPYVADDAFISLRYAEHLAQDHGPVYNVGERVEGYTNFLWTAALAVPFILHLNPILFLKLANVTLALGSALLVWRLAGVTRLLSEPGATPVSVAPAAPAGGSRKQRAKRHGPSAPAPRPPQGIELAAVPALLFLATPAVIVSAAEGLETMLFVFLLLLGLMWFFEERERRGVLRSAVALAALAMTRPDGAPFGVWLLGAAGIQRRPRRYLLLFAALFLGLVAAYQAWRTLYYGHPFPNTFYAKGAGGLVLVERGWSMFTRFAVESGAWAWIAMLPAFFARRTRGAALVLGGVVLLRFAFHILAGGPWQGRDRFLVPMLPLIHLLVVAGLSILFRGARARAAALTGAAAMMLVPGWLAYPRTEQTCLGYSQALLRAHIPLGLEIRARTAPEAVIAMDDAGVGPYLSERTNIDMLGLNDAHIAHLPGRFLEKFDVRYVLNRRPDLVVLLGRVEHPATDADLRLPGHAAMFGDPEFRAHYQFARSFPFAPNYHLLVFRRTDSRAVPPDF